jgi:hypothetical protein
MSTRLREETALAILYEFIHQSCSKGFPSEVTLQQQSPKSVILFESIGGVLSSVGAVVHEQKLNILGVVDEESLVAGGHHVTGLLVASITNLYQHISSAKTVPVRSILFRQSADLIGLGLTYGWHGDGALEASADAVVDTLGLAP